MCFEPVGEGIAMAGFLMTLIIGLLMVLPFWKIFGRVGFPPWLSILMIVPVVNLITIYFVAFSEWPAMPDNK
jgi:hypothetical protein